MYTLEIDFKTENEDIRLTKDTFPDIIEAAAFAIEFVQPYIMKYKVAQGQWRVYRTDNPDMIERYCKIESLLSLRANEAASGL